METWVSIGLGLGLAAACGFRVFVPCLVISLGQRYGVTELDAFPDWMGSLPALIAFSTATVAELGAYYVPVVDNILDAIMTPLAVIAGILLFGGATEELSPLARWSLAVIAGGASAGATHGLTTVTRAVSSATTAGLGNFVVSTVELVLSTLISVAAAVIPVVVPLVLLAIAVYGVRVWRRRRAEVST